MFSNLGYSTLNLILGTNIGQNLLLNAGDSSKTDFTKGIGSNGGSANATAVQTSMNTLVKTLITFGGIWVVACIVFAGIKLSGAQGKNPENRTQAIVGLVSAAIGGFVMIKAYSIAGWVASL